MGGIREGLPMGGIRGGAPTSGGGGGGPTRGGGPQSEAGSGKSLSNRVSLIRTCRPSKSLSMSGPGHRVTGSASAAARTKSGGGCTPSEHRRALATSAFAFTLFDHARSAVARPPAGGRAPSERRAYLEAEHPEFFPVVSYFGGDSFVRGLRETILPVADELLDGKKGAEHAKVRAKRD